MKRVKTVKVAAANKADAIVELQPQADLWVKSLAGQSCKVCSSIIKEIDTGQAR
jgi:hypothetical protein